MELWFVAGDPHNYRFNTKMAAEIWARKLHPDEAPDKRYARVFYVTLKDEQFARDEEPFL